MTSKIKVKLLTSVPQSLYIDLYFLLVSLVVLVHSSSHSSSFINISTAGIPITDLANSKALETIKREWIPILNSRNFSLNKWRGLILLENNFLLFVSMMYLPLSLYWLERNIVVMTIVLVKKYFYSFWYVGDVLPEI